MTNPTRRLTIGLLTTIGLEDQYQISILRGALAAAEARDINLIIYGGGKLESPLRDHINANVIYDLAAESITSIDAIIFFTGTMMGLMSSEQRAAFCRRYPVPQVSIGIDLPGAHGVLLDNGAGIRDAIAHLITVHNYRRIAFIQGSEGNQEASVRFQAYLDTLKEFGIPYDPQLVVSGNFQTRDGAEAVRILLDERQVIVDAIVGANDNMAIGALNELKKRAISVPGKIAVVGFDDVEDAEAIIPALTTVRQPLYEQGKQGVELVLALLRGKTVDNPLILSPDLVLRRSCGCSSVVGMKAEPIVSDNLSAEVVEKLLVDAKMDTVTATANVVPNSRNVGAFGKMYDAFLHDLFCDPNSDPPIRFILLMDAVTRQALLENAQLHRWHEILTVMRRAMLPALQANVEIHTQAETLWQQARILISEAIQHAESNRRLQIKLHAQALGAIGEPMVTEAEDLTRLTAVMQDEFPVLGIKACHLILYSGLSRDKSFLAFSYSKDNDQISLAFQSNEERFRADATDTNKPERLLSGEWIARIIYASNRRRSVLVQSLSSDDVQFGFVVLEIGQPQPYIYEALRKQFSSSLHTSFLMQQLEEKHSLLESALQDIKKTQAMLVHNEKMTALGQMVAGVAHEINNPLSFVYSNVHTLRKTFEEFSEAYETLENAVRNTAQPIDAAALAQLRKKNGLDFLMEDTEDLVAQTLNGLKRVKTIVEELRKFARLDEAEFKVSNLRENIESTLLVARGTLGQRISVDIDIDPNLEFTCAAAQLNQVFLNMMINAGQAIKEKGTIYISAHEDIDQVVIQFRDTGSGMPESVMARIFDPFFTTKPVGVGTGLGLSISHKIIVDGHRGAISVSSIPDVGTTFTITLPKDLQPA